MKYWKKMIAPIIIGILIILICVVYLWVLQLPGVHGAVKWIGGAVIAGLIGTMIFVTVERIHEIRSGEEDDLSKY